MLQALGTNPHQPMRVGEFETLVEGLDWAARGTTGFNFFSGRGQLVASLSYAELRERARDLAVRFVASGFERGDRLAIIAETTVDFAVVFFACQYAGLIPVPLPLNLSVGGYQHHIERLRGMLKSASPVAAVASTDLIGALREAAAGCSTIRMIGSPEDFYGLAAGSGMLRPFEKDDPCYIQYSSGSTTEPKGVLATQRAVTSNARAIGQFGLRLVPGDRATSWLPLYHDMGLVGFCITPMLSQVTVDYMSASAFAQRPMTWLRLISTFGGTISFSPTFGYELCVRRVGREPVDGLTLGQWRIAGVGGDMVRPEGLDRFAETFAASGFDAAAFLPSYGLAEATLAVSFSPLLRGVRVDMVDRAAYEQTGYAVSVANGRTTNGVATDSPAPARRFAFCGRPLPGCTIEIRDDKGCVLPERHLGHVFVRGPSLMREYFGRPDATQAVLGPDGCLDTGDMGYLVEGELVVTGRSKDLIIVKGRNLWPQDLEWAIERLPDVRAGSVAAFSLGQGDEDERVAIVVECYLQDPDLRLRLRQDVASTAHRIAGVHAEVAIVPPRSLRFTSSGKLSRAATRSQYLEGRLTQLIDHAQPIAAATSTLFPPLTGALTE